MLENERNAIRDLNLDIFNLERTLAHCLFIGEYIFPDDFEIPTKVFRKMNLIESKYRYFSLATTHATIISFRDIKSKMVHGTQSEDMKNLITVANEMANLIDEDAIKEQNFNLLRWKIALYRFREICIDMALIKFEIKLGKIQNTFLIPK